MKRAVLSVSHLTVSYENNPALWDISCDIGEGYLTAIIGPNGAGKSTFLKAILGLIRISTGEISFLGEPLSRVQKKIAYVPQRDSVDWDFPMTLFELVLMGMYGKMGLFRWPGKKERERVHSSLEKVGLLKYAERQINELSLGQKQRAFVARALCQDAEIYFMDEPLAGIDAASSDVILDLLRELKNEKKSLFIVHHDLESVARTFDLALLFNTHLIALGPVHEVLTLDNIERSYGKSALLLDRVARIAKEKREGNIA